MGRRRDRSCVSLTVDCGDLPGAAADTAEAPIAPTQGGVGKLTTAADASAMTSFHRGNRASTIEHGFDRSRRKGQPAPHAIEKNPQDRANLVAYDSADPPLRDNY